MADELAIIAELGDDTELLLAPDAWLENQRVYLQQSLALIAQELEGVLVAQRIKIQLQQQNLVAVRCVDKEGGVPSDVSIRICRMTDAIARLAAERADPQIPTDVSEENARQQLDTWRSDGYDVDAAERLRRKPKERG